MRQWELGSFIQTGVTCFWAGPNELDHKVPPEDSRKFLDQLGLDGWELVNVTSTAVMGVNVPKLWFKRRLS